MNKPRFFSKALLPALLPLALMTVPLFEQIDRLHETNREISEVQRYRVLVAQINTLSKSFYHSGFLLLGFGISGNQSFAERYEKTGADVSLEIEKLNALPSDQTTRQAVARAIDIASQGTKNTKEALSLFKGSDSETLQSSQKFCAAIRENCQQLQSVLDELNAETVDLVRGEAWRRLERLSGLCIFIAYFLAGVLLCLFSRDFVKQVPDANRSDAPPLLIFGKGLLPTFLPLLLFNAVLIVSSTYTQAVERDLKQQVKNSSIMFSANWVARLFYDTGVSVQNYAISKDKAALDKYAAYVRQLPVEIAELRRLVGDNPLQQQRLNKLEGTVNDGIAVFNQAKVLLSEEKPNAAQLHDMRFYTSLRDAGDSLQNTLNELTQEVSVINSRSWLESSGYSGFGEWIHGILCAGAFAAVSVHAVFKARRYAGGLQKHLEESQSTREDSAASTVTEE